MLIHALVNRAVNPPAWFAQLDVVSKSSLSYDDARLASCQVPDDLLDGEVQAGCYGKVFVFDEYVIKVCLSPDDGAIAFLEWVKDHPSKHFPTVLWTQNTKGVFIAVMERLEELPTVEGSSYESIEGPTRRAFREVVLYHPVCTTELLSDSMMAAALALRGSGLAEEYGCDMHEGNWMVRKDGTLVCNDPFAGRLAK